MNEPVVLNLFAGPGTGKSTIASLVFGKLKVMGVNAEYVSEFAKDLTWEERHDTLSFQPYVTAKQMWRLERLRGKVDVVVTDSPLLLGLVYQGRGCTPAFPNFVLEVFNSYNNLNFFIERDPAVHPFNPKGRSQCEEEAKLKDTEIRNFLVRYGIDYKPVPMMEGEQTADYIRDQVIIHRIIHAPR